MDEQQYTKYIYHKRKLKVDTKEQKTNNLGRVNVKCRENGKINTQQRAVKPTRSKKNTVVGSQTTVSHKK